MKLIDLLVQELPKRGGWPDGAVEAEVFIYDGGLVNFWTEEGKAINGGASSFRLKGLDLCQIETVTRAEYEAALAAAQQPVWDGEGLPPVGCECQIKFIGDTPPAQWFSFKLIGIHDEIAIITLDGENTWRHISKLSLDEVKFRPIRSEADKKRDEAVEALGVVFGRNEHDGPLSIIKSIYDAIATGKIPGVKLSD